MFDLFSDAAKVAAQMEIISSEYGFALWETLYSLALEVLFAYVVGLPLGVLLVTGEKDGIHPLPKWLMAILNGIITLKEGVGMEATALDIVENPKNVEIVEMEAAQIAGVRDSVALAVINGNYALNAGLNAGTDAIATEDPNSVSAQTYANVLVVKEGNENTEKTQALQKALTSQEVKDYINETYSGAVVPIF